MARNKEICLIAADEAHFINCWKSFRPEYNASKVSFSCNIINGINSNCHFRS
uniref:Uncharacterized protein n=1 Tax=Amphimedon queenslandica TaxID=400682 RepID=A0A1X7TUG2_AMPQE